MKSIVIVLVAALLSPSVVKGGGLLRSVWGCSVPCESSRDGVFLGSIQVSYCGTQVLNPSMIDKLTPACREKTGRADAVAVRSSAATIASCATAANPCKDEGLTPSGFVCSYRCPAEDPVLRKYVACASTGHEAWRNVASLCRAPLPPASVFGERTFVCVSEGQTPCE